MIITLTGHKNTKKDYIANKLCENSEVHYIKPYCDCEVTLRDDTNAYYDYHQVSKEKLDSMIKEYEVISIREINGIRFVFFEFQLDEGYNVMIVDDYSLMDVRANYPTDELFAIKLKSDDEVKSDRVDVYLYDHEFDEVFDVDYGDLDLLEVKIYDYWSKT